MLWLEIIEIVFLAIIFVISVSLHEYAHAWTSNYFGDPTPKLQWRLTPNPLVHIDPIWFIMIFLIHFWRWRPVIVNPSYYKHRLRDELLVALAWPFTNILLAIFASCIMILYVLIVWFDGIQEQDLVLSFRQLFGLINIALAVFNLIPLPPLDGYRIVKYLKPTRWVRLEHNYRIISILLILFVVFPTPVSQLLGQFIRTVSYTWFWIIHWITTFLLL